MPNSTPTRNPDAPKPTTAFMPNSSATGFDLGKAANDLLSAGAAIVTRYTNPTMAQPAAQTAAPPTTGTTTPASTSTQTGRLFGFTGSSNALILAAVAAGVYFFTTRR